MLPPLITQTTFFPASRSRSFHRRHERRRAGALGKVVRRAQREADALSELVLAQRDDVVELLFEDPERQVERDARRHTFGEGVGLGADHARVAFPRAREGSARSACTPMITARLPSGRPNQAQPHAPLPRRSHEDDFDVGFLFEISSA